MGCVATLLYGVMRSITSLSVQFHCECNMQMDRVWASAQLLCSVRFSFFFFANSKFITLFYNLVKKKKKDEKMGFIVIKLRYQSFAK
jgi:hypothetical protein